MTLRAVNSEVSLEQLATVKAKIDKRTISTADLHGMPGQASGNGMGHLEALL